MGAHVGLVYRMATPDDLSGALFRGAGRPRIYPFYEMEVGQIVVIDNPALRASARYSAIRAAKINGWKFKTKVRDDGSLLVKRVQ